MWLCDLLYGNYTTADDYLLNVNSSSLPGTDWVCWCLGDEGAVLWDKWFNTSNDTDSAISGVLADWLDDHRDSLLNGAVGPDPAGRLDLLIRWLREVRCWGKESVSV